MGAGNTKKEQAIPISKSSEAANTESREVSVGQHVKIEGRGRWLGQSFSAIVVDVRQSDTTVKVRFCDGGFKRYTRVEFTEIANEQPLASEVWQSGAHVYMKGIGQWWSGQHYSAQIVEVRDADDTVKVRYTDGGFKRFTRDEFQSMMLEDQTAVPEVYQFDWYSSGSGGHVSEMRKLHDEIMTATRKGDTEKVADLKNRYDVLSQKQDDLKVLNARLADAIARADYLAAHKLHQEIANISGSAPQPPAPPSAISQIEPIKDALSKSMYAAIGGGLAGAFAMSLQVTTLMWLRTTINYQYRHGISTRDALRTLYAQGGVFRFYQGIGPALFQGPALRFGDTAANAGVLAFFEETDAKNLPIFIKTAFASSLASIMRILFVPVDTVKTVMQVEGKEGLPRLRRKMKKNGPAVFFRGAVAFSAATFVSHYPWFTVFNVLNSKLPNYDDRPQQLLRNAGIGFCASVASDTVANSLRVVKTVRQTSDRSYSAIVRRVVEKDGVASLFGRGLPTRICANGCSGILFSVLYKMFEERFVQKGV